MDDQGHERRDDATRGSGPSDTDRSHGRDERRYSPSGVGANRWVKRLVWALVAVAVAYAAYLLAAAFFPRWWAQRVADQVQGDFTNGITWGLFYGFVFTFVPLLVLVQVRRRFLSWTWRAVVVVVAVALALPNWLTLSVVAGSSNAAHAGERILDVDAPGFRAASAIGSVVAVVLVVVITAAGVLAARRRREVRDLKGRLDERDAARREGSGTTPS